MKKVFIVVSDINIAGGGEVFANNLRISLKKFDYDCEILSLNNIYSKQASKKNNSMPIFGILSRLLIFLCKVIYLKRYLYNNPSNFVVSVGTYSSLVTALTFSKTLNISSLHSSADVEKWWFPAVSNLLAILSLYYIYLYRHADKKIVRVFKSKIKLISNFHTIDYCPNAQVLQNRFCSKTLLYCGRFDQNKNLCVLVDIFNKINKTDTAWRLILVGRGDAEAEIKALVHELGLSNFIKILPYHSDLHEFYNSATIYVSTSLSEAFPMTIIEAQAYGLPVVVFDSTPAYNILIKLNDTGFVIDKNDMDSFVNSIMHISSTYEIYCKYSNRALLNSKNYSENVIINQWISILQSNDT